MSLIVWLTYLLMRACLPPRVVAAMLTPDNLPPLLPEWADALADLAHVGPFLHLEQPTTPARFPARMTLAESAPLIVLREADTAVYLYTRDATHAHAWRPSGMTFNTAVAARRYVENLSGVILTITPAPVYCNWIDHARYVLLLSPRERRY